MQEFSADLSETGPRLTSHLAKQLPSKGTEERSDDGPDEQCAEGADRDDAALVLAAVAGLLGLGTVTG